MEQMHNSHITLLTLALTIKEPIIIGEQFKGGTFRPCQETIPAATIEGAFFHHFGVQLPAVGRFDPESYTRKEFTYSLRDRGVDSATLPITTSYLAPSNTHADQIIRATIYLPYSEQARALEPSLQNTEFRLGALRNKGFGRCSVSDITPQTVDIVQGLLAVKIFEADREAFGIRVLSPMYGYLFKLIPERSGGSDNGTTSLPAGVYHRNGAWRRALFPGSVVYAPRVLLQAEKETYYDEKQKQD